LNSKLPKNATMKKIYAILIAPISLVFFNIGVTNAQLTTTPDGGNKVALIGERIGLTDVTIHYNRPGMKNREGKIWGTLVPVGFVSRGFGNAKLAPWRAGANECTTIEFSTSVKIEGHLLPQGKYGFFVAYDSLESTIIFSKDNNSWGSFFYNPAEDVLRVKVKPKALKTSVEWMQFQFTNQTDSSATVELQWDSLSIPFNIGVDLVATQLESFRKELQTEKGFTYLSWVQAAQWCIQHNTNLEQALLWTDTATTEEIFYGDRSFQSWSAKSLVLYKLGRKNEADSAIKKGLPFGSEIELYLYARQLQEQKRPTEAFDIYKINYDRYPNKFLTSIGMAEGYSRLGNYKTALVFAKKALQLAPDENNKSYTRPIIAILEQGKDFTE
jgi:tetratricopeptide (TPR) repeat protein